MVSLDAGELTTRQLNVRLKELAQAGEEIEVLNPQARHNIAVGIFHSCKISIKGSVGYYCASLLDGPEVTIDGNAGWVLGENLMSGKIALGSDAGASVAASMRGGEVIVWGGAGARAGISMKGGNPGGPGQLRLPHRVHDAKGPDYCLWRHRGCGGRLHVRGSHIRRW